MLLQVAADQALARAVAVHVGGVDQVAPGLDGGGDGGQGDILVDRAVFPAELPGAETTTPISVPIRGKLRFSTRSG